MSEWWDSFSNNLATDLTPLISLFGEAPTKQYLSECIDLIDVLIFAIAPLGILTAVVSAIRVCGTPALRAFIGRAQEGGGNAEAELCSSTSREVCELYNHGGIARVFGRPKLLEIVHDQEVTNKDFYRWSEELSSAGIYSFEKYFQQSVQEWDELTNKRKPDEETTTASNSGPQEQRFAPNPNLSLNVGIKPRDRGLFIAAATIGIILQAAVLVWASVARYIFQLRRGHSQDSYAVPLIFIGTVLLMTGIALCAFLIEESTKERIFTKRNHHNRSRIYWLQPGTQFVGDQAFDSFAYTHPDSGLTRYITSWKDTNPFSGNWVWVAITLTMVGFILQFLGLRSCHSSVAIAQLALTIMMSVVRAMLRTGRLTKEEIFLADSSEHYEKHELDWLALNLGRGLEKNDKKRTSSLKRGWYVSSARFYYYPVQWPKEEAGANGLLQLRVLANGSCMLAGFRSSNSKSSADYIRFSENWRAKIHTVDEDGQTTQSKTPDPWKSKKPHDIARVWLYRARLTQLTSKWEEDNLVAVRNTARLLARAIEATAQVLYTADVVFEQGWSDVFALVWPVKCALFDENERSFPSDTDANVYLSLRREIDEGRQISGIWSVDESELEAVLGLWLWSLKDIDDGKFLKAPLKRILSVELDQAGTAAEQDFKLWLGAGGFRIAKVQDVNLPPHSSQHRLDKVETTEHGYRLFGWQNVSAGPTTNIKFLEVQAMTKSLVRMCAQEIYALFFMSIIHIINDISGKTEVTDGRHFHLVNTTVSQIQEAFTESGLGSFEDALACIIPSLRIQGKLPIGTETLYAARNTAETYVNDKRWEEAERLLLWALPHAKQRITTSDDTVDSNKQMEAINHLRMLILALCECYRKALISGVLDFGSKGILDLLTGPVFPILKQITLSTTKSSSSYTLAATVRCYGRVALRYVQEENKKDVVKKLEKEVYSSLEDCDSAKIISIRDLRVIQPNKESERLLSEAIKGDDLSLTLFLLGGKSNVIVKEKNDPNKSVLSLAAEKGWYMVAKALIDCGAVLEGRDMFGRTPISYAAETGDINIFDYLLGKGSFPNFGDRYRRTPLSYAAERGHVAIVKTLLGDVSDYRSTEQ
jgi:uncharacterized membrane protein